MIAEVGFDLTFTGPGATWALVRMQFTEGLSTLDEGALEIATDELDADPEDLFDQRAVITLRRGDNPPRYFTGRVVGIDDLGVTADRRLARVLLAPDLWLLGQRSDWRIYQDLDALEIVAEVLRDAGLYAGERLDLKAARAQRLPRREYCVQFGETDLAFVCRLLEDEGLSFRFEHGDEDETLVILDGATMAPFAPVTTPDGASVALVGEGGATADTETVRRFERARAMRPTGVTLRDFDFFNPDATAALSATTQTSPARTLYGYPAGVTFEDLDGARRHNVARLTTVRHQSESARERRARGVGNVLGFAPGAAFALDAHGRGEIDGKWLITRAVHRGHAPESLYGGEVETGREDRYFNHFEVVRAGTPIRPPRVTPRPQASFPQTARVSSEPGSNEPIVTDAQGRVLVRFHWERPERRSDTQRNKRASCWVRVAQPWAGAGMGVTFIPRVGMEVVVQFLDGDPDRPIVTGCVHNGLNPPPLSLPSDRTASVIRTESVGGAVGFNELRFEDRAGAEEVFLHAQNALRVQARGPKTTDVGGSDTLSVADDSTVMVGGSRVETVRGERVVTVMGGDTMTVLGDRQESTDGTSRAVVRGDGAVEYGGGLALSVGGGVNLRVGAREGDSAADEDVQKDAAMTVEGSWTAAVNEDVVLLGRRSVVLQCGDSRIELRPEGVIVRAKEITLHAAEEATVRTDDAAFVLTDEAELVGDAVKLYGPSSRLVLDGEATLKGAKVHIGFGTGKPVPFVKDDTVEAVFRFVRNRAREPIGDLKVKIRHPDGVVREHVTDASGHVRIEGASQDQFEVVEVVDADHLAFARQRARRR